MPMSLSSKAALRVGKVVLRFQKEKRPAARQFYQAELGELGRENRKGWAIPKAGCPFHQSRSKTSFAVNLQTGGYYCHGCGVSGGDIIDFLMLRDSLTFKEACTQIGCWDEDAKPVKVNLGPPVRYLVLDFIVDGVEYHSEAVRDEPRTYADKIRRFYREASDQLTAPDQSGSDASETCWARMALGLDELRELGIL